MSTSDSEESFHSAKSHELSPTDELPPRFPHSAPRQSSPYLPRSTAAEKTVSFALDDGDNDWGSVSELEPVAPHAARGARSYIVPPLALADTPTGETLRLRGEESRPAGGALNLPLIGMYADPGAEKDDWADDFDLESPDAIDVPIAPLAPSPFLEPLHEPQWPASRDSPIISSQVFNRLNVPVQPPRLDLNARSIAPPLASEYAQSSEGGDVLHGTFPSTPIATPLGQIESVLGYDATEVHQSCAHLREVFARHSIAITQHVDGVIRELGKNLAAVDMKAQAKLLYSFDDDVALLSNLHRAAAPDILEWKLELASLMADRVGVARAMLGLARYASLSGDIEQSQTWLGRATEETDTFNESSFGIALRIEADYESAVNERSRGNLEEAQKCLDRAISRCSDLTRLRSAPGDIISPALRGVWWSLRCKYILAEICEKQVLLPAAIQHYAEFSVECIARMLGLVAPIDSENTYSNSLPWYYLFSPRSLVSAIWACTRLLYELRALVPAIDVASVAINAATLFGNKNVNDGATELRASAKSALREHKRLAAEKQDSGTPGEAEFGRRAPGLYDDFGSSNFTRYGDDIASLESEEDWDQEFERKHNIKIERCSNTNRFPEGAGTTGEAGTPLAVNASHTEEHSFLSSTGNALGSAVAVRTVTPIQTNVLANSHRSASTDLMESELRLYLNRIHGAAASLSVYQSYPKPTVPFDGAVLQVKEHEAFLRNFVRGEDPRFKERLRSGNPPDSVWDPTFIEGRHGEDPMILFRTKAMDIERLSSRWATLVLETVWNILRGVSTFEEKRSNISALLQTTIQEATELASRSPVQHERGRMERLDILATLIEALRLSREILSSDGGDAQWFSVSCTRLGTMASTVKPAAKAAVELFQAESRAHCGVGVVTEPEFVKVVAETKNTKSNVSLIEANFHESIVVSSLRQSVVDILHALFWRTKSGFDENSSSISFERLVHADVTATLLLTGCGISSVDGSSITVVKDESILHLHEPGQQGKVVDETRRVHGPELVQELQNLWASLPTSAALVRAKVSFALAIHSEVEPHEYGRTEQFLFDGLQALHAVSSASQEDPVSFFSTLARVSPIAVVSSPLSEAMLRAYGRLTLIHSKYRYGIAALEAASDCRRVRDLRNVSSLALAMDVATAALAKGDWRRALVILYDLRGVVHPKDGKRDDFIHLCLLLHQMCADVGCFSAAIVPLRAFSALIYEERLRVLLLPNRRRLARKSRNRKNFQSAISPLSTRHPKGPYLKASSGSSLAALLDSPPVREANNVHVDDATNPSYSTPILPLGSDSVDPSASAPTLASQKKPSSRFSVNYSRRSATRTNGSLDSGSSEARHHSRGNSASNPLATGARPASSRDGNSVRKRPRPKPHLFEEEQKELVRIEAEQESNAGAERFKVEFLLIKTAFNEGRYIDANTRCLGLLDMKIPPKSRIKVCEIRARIALKRREISRCIELIDFMEREIREGFSGRQRSESMTEHNRSDHNYGLSGTDDSARTVVGDSAPLFIPSTTFLRLTALLHGGRLSEGLSLADDSLKLCPESELWNNARLHYIRGKILYAISCISTAPFDNGEAMPLGFASNNAVLDIRSITLTLSAFETASKYYDAAGDEIGMLKSDLLWARVCIDTLFRRAVLPAESGGGIALEAACSLGGRTINPAEVEEAVHHVLHLASTANLPLVLIDALAALAEIKCIRGEPTHSWNAWVTQGWRLFSRFFVNSEDFTVLLADVAPVSTLVRLRKVCGRLVRLVLCGPKAENVAAINRHIHMFEAYVTLQVQIDRRMNLATTAQRKTSETGTSVESDSVSSSQETKEVVPEKKRYPPKGHSPKRSDSSIERASGMQERLAAVKRHYRFERSPNAGGTPSRTSRESVRTEPSHRPAGAFLHALGTEGAALGRIGLAKLINRPRKTVVSAVMETGAVLIPSNFFSNSRVEEPAGAHVLGEDAERIFPFNEMVGLGAMHILDGPPKKCTSKAQPTPSGAPSSNGAILKKVSMNSDIGEQQQPGAPQMAKKRSNRNSDGIRRQSRKRGGSSSKVYTEGSDGANEGVTEIENGSGMKDTSSDSSTEMTKSELCELVEAVRAAENDGGRPLPPEVFGNSPAQRVWAHLHRIKTEKARYVHGGMSLEELGNRNREAVRSWLLCCPNSKKEWTVPESIAKRLVYVLFAHGVLGYYVVDSGGCAVSAAFGGKQPRGGGATFNPHPRTINDAERAYLFNLVKDWRRGGPWYKDRDSSIINGLGVSVLRAPRTLLPSNPHSHKKSRPIVLLADPIVQVLPWELFFDHVVIRALCLIDVIRGVQEDSPPAPQPIAAPSLHSNRALVRFICFTSSRREGGDTEKSEEARRQHFAFQSLLRLNHLCAAALSARLGLGRFSDPTAVNAVRRPTGPLSTPLSQSRKAAKLLGVRIESIIGQRNYPHVDFLKIPGLGAATTADLREAANALLVRVNEKDGETLRDVGDYITVFLFTYADLIGASQSVFGLTSAVRRSILMFTPATQMKVLARHLEDAQLTAELNRAFRGVRPDVCACARILVEYVSRFSRDKRIPIVVFLGEGLVDVFPRKRERGSIREPNTLMPAAESLFQRSSRPTSSPYR